MRYFSLPTNGDIVWCLFSESLGNPGPKPHTALIIEIGAVSNNKPEALSFVRMQVK
jgi:hypothetical protein